MSELVDGDDGLPAAVVGAWAKTKHDYLCRYVDITRGVRGQWIEPGKAGATYIDTFCGPGRALIRGTSEFIEGSAVTAWNKSVAIKVPFSAVYIGDAEPAHTAACAERLRKLGAPVHVFTGDAVATTEMIVAKLNPHGLHFAFIDPFNLEALNFQIIRRLSALKRIDMLVHVSQMDLQRNLDRHTKGNTKVFDAFIPGWRERLVAGSATSTRQAVLRDWASQVASLGVWPSADPKLVTGSKNQPLYWLLLAAKHDLALAFWKVASNREKQGAFEF